MVEIAHSFRCEEVSSVLGSLGEDYQTTRSVIRAAARLPKEARNVVLWLLMRQSRNSTRFMEEAIAEIAGNFDEESMELVLERWLHILISDGNLVATLGIVDERGSVMKLLLDRFSGHSPVTEKGMKSAVAMNSWKTDTDDGQPALQLLLDHGGEASITYDVLKTVFMNSKGEDIA